MPESKDNNLPASGKESPDVTPDPLNDRIMKMFLLEDLKKIDALSDEEIEYLASSDDSSDDILAEADSAFAAEPQAEQPTQSKDGETQADPGSVFHEEGANEDILNMLGKVISFEKKGSVTLLGRYRKAAKLGSGGQGIVYLVEGEDDFSAAFALKAFLPRGYDSREDFADDMVRMKRIASIIHHQPHDDLVEVGWFGQCNNDYTMLMQYIDGVDLRQLLQPQLLQWLKQCVGHKRWTDLNNVVYSVGGSQQLAMKPAIAVYIMERVLRGLMALHDRDIIHGDIKPSNIMLSASGSVKIIDVGSAFEDKARPSRHHFTPAYVAPEFLENGEMSPLSDLASVGYMLIELLTGMPITDVVPNVDASTRTIGVPTRDQLLEVKKSLPNRLREILPGEIGKGNDLVELCRRLIDPNPKNRFQSAAQCIVDSKGTYAFSKDLTLAGLAVCSYHEILQLLANVKQAMQLANEDPQERGTMETAE